MHGGLGVSGSVWWGWLVALPLFLCAGYARAEADDAFVLPRDPRTDPARWVLEVHLDGIFTADVDALCPAESRCIYEGGGGIGSSAELRWPRGIGFFVDYDAWFIDSGAVFELGVQQGLYLGARYTVPNPSWVHPVLDAGVGATVYGDTFTADSAGILLTGKVGLHFELSRHFGVLGGLGIRAFTHSPFTSQRDRVRRGGGDAFSQVLFLQVALTIDGRPWEVAEP